MVKPDKAFIARHKLDMFPITLALAMNQKGINKVTLDVPMPETNSAGTWRINTEQSGYVILVAVDNITADDDILLHEAVHVFQSICKIIGESNPGAEMQAYHIQYICKLLVEMRDDLMS